MARTRFGRVRAAAVGSITVVALLAGCGGSAVEGAAPGQDAVVDQTGSQASVDAGVSDAATAAVPGAADSSGTSGVGGASGTAQVPGAVEQNKVAVKGPQADKADKADKAGVGQSGTSVGSGKASTLAAEQAVASAAIFGGNAPCKPATLSEVNIGNVSTLSGVLGELFSPVTSALTTFVASQNACGGLNGHKIKFFQADDQGDPTTAATKAQEMIQTKKILAFVGNIQVLTVDAMVPVIKRTGIPVLGSDMSNNTWFTNPLLFPQGAPPQASSYGFNLAARDYYKKPAIGTLWCLEVPRACEAFNRAVKDLAPEVGVAFKRDFQVSITAPSYVQQCLDLQKSGVESLVLLIDAASMNRVARSCTQVGFKPATMAPPIAVGNEKQFLSGNPWLGNSYLALNTFPWIGNTTPAEKYWQASIQKFNPGFASGGAASLGWASGALLVAASAGLDAANPTTQQILDTLWTFKGQKFTELGGLAGPRTFGKNMTPKVPYCLYTMISNDANTGWKTVVSKPTCTDKLSPSDPQRVG